MSIPSHHYSIGAVNVTLRSACRTFADEYASLYQSYRRPSPGPATIDIELRPRRRYPWPRGPYTFRSPGAPDFVVERKFEVLPHLEWYINWQIIHGRPEWVQLHASSLELEGRAIIFPGDPGSGKSTLTAGLLTRGWSYLCDEFALIHPTTRQVQPFPRALCIKEGSFEVIRRLGLPLRRKTPYRKPTKGRVAFLNPLDHRSDSVGRASPIAWVVFPKYVSGAVPRLEPITKSQAAYDLARQCFNIRVDQQRAVACLASVARGAECYRLVAGDIDDTCDLLESLAAATASRKAG